ncbi:MAG: RNA polymerase subunit sigma [Myxococcales bacterium]|nr:RNA polymerase subunit sigma [Myxococcales bacterium]
MDTREPEPLERLIDGLQSARAIVVVSGAGISLASGIPTFRGADPGAVWANEVLERGTLAYFLKHPVEQWRWYLERFAGLAAARPNPAHEALARLERWQAARGGDFTLITQNIDSLHEDAGSRALIKIHGSADKVRCVSRDCELGAPRGLLPASSIDLEAFMADPSNYTVPRCDECGALLRPHILWFDEYYTGHRDYRVDEALRAVKRAAAIVYVGTSFAVGITEMTLETALARGRDVFSLDPGRPPPHRRVLWLRARAEEALPQLVAALERG